MATQFDMATQLDRIEKKLNWAIEGIAALEAIQVLQAGHGNIELWREEGRKRLKMVI